MKTLVLLLALGGAWLRSEELVQPRIKNTPAGIRFGLIGEKGATPKPAVVIFAKNIERNLTDPECNRVGILLRERTGCVLVSLDAPAHGADRRPGEPSAGLLGWARRVRAGEEIVAPFLAKVSAVLDFLAGDGTIDAGRIGVYGVSRGGFLALNLAAADPRIKWCAAFAPVTDLLALEEFRGMNANVKARALGLDGLAPRLAGRPIWITIGNSDDRVGTDDAIRFSRRVVEASLAQGRFPDVELRVTTARGHTRAPGDWEAAVAWALPRI